MKALLSVFDKTGVVEFGRGLARLGVEIYSTAGTLNTLADAGVAAHPIADLTGSPDILGGRVATLHPAIHGPLAADADRPDQVAEITSSGFGPIEIVAVNLCPMSGKPEEPGQTLGATLDVIDIGDAALLRAGGKNHDHVIVLADPADYPAVLEGLRDGGISAAERRRLAAKAFQHCACYDTQVAGYLRAAAGDLPDCFTVALEKQADMRYGENPHQKGAIYLQTPNPRRDRTLVGAQQLAGKPRSFTDTLDVDAALNIVREFAATTVVVVKHGNPCGLACGESQAETYRRAASGDPQAAIGGCLGFNTFVNDDTARLVAQTYYEDLIAPGYTDEALEILRQISGLRLYQVSLDALDEEALRANPTLDLDFKRISGGFLVQTADSHSMDETSYSVVSSREPNLEELTDLMFAWRAVKHVRSNAVVVARRLCLVGVGAGQMTRPDATSLALRKAADRSFGSVLASDAYFATPEGIELAADARVTAVIQPGGAPRDEEVRKAVDRHHMAMVLTGFRHFRHS